MGAAWNFYQISKRLVRLWHIYLELACGGNNSCSDPIDSKIGFICANLHYTKLEGKLGVSHYEANTVVGYSARDLIFCDYGTESVTFPLPRPWFGRLYQRVSRKRRQELALASKALKVTIQKWKTLPDGTKKLTVSCAENKDSYWIWPVMLVSWGPVDRASKAHRPILVVLASVCVLYMNPSWTVNDFMLNLQELFVFLWTSRLSLHILTRRRRRATWWLVESSVPGVHLRTPSRYGPHWTHSSTSLRQLGIYILLRHHGVGPGNTPGWRVSVNSFWKASKWKALKAWCAWQVVEYLGGKGKSSTCLSFRGSNIWHSRCFMCVWTEMQTSSCLTSLARCFMWLISHKSEGMTRNNENTHAWNTREIPVKCQVYPWMTMFTRELAWNRIPSFCVLN